LLTFNLLSNCNLYRYTEAALHDVCKRLLDETMALERDAAPVGGGCTR
jgi:hypothetical protein